MLTECNDNRWQPNSSRRDRKSANRTMQSAAWEDSRRSTGEVSQVEHVAVSEFLSKVSGKVRSLIGWLLLFSAPFVLLSPTPRRVLTSASLWQPRCSQHGFSGSF